MRALFSRLMAAAVIAASVFAAAGAASQAQTVNVIYRFTGGKDGAGPYAGLTFSDRVKMGNYIYGTTEVGGSGTGCFNAFGCGTAFQMTLDGEEVHRTTFTGPNGAFPQGDLLVVGRQLFGTTYAGGNTGCDGEGCGTVFTLPNLTVERRFLGSDGANPISGLTCEMLEDNKCTSVDELYGTTRNGGEYGLGTVFELETEKPLFSFDQGNDYGTNPDGTLVLVEVKGKADTLYGTTSTGGSMNCPGGCGALFRKSKSEQAWMPVYYFKGGADGAAPLAGLIYVPNIDMGILFGTTAAGGGTGCDGVGCGTVFAETLQGGRPLVLHRFKGGKDGAVPVASLLYVAGKTFTIYGTTEYGGGQGACPLGGCGTLFRLTKERKFEVIYSFRGGTEGARPTGKLIQVGNALYGTTYAGGTGCAGVGCGTVYKVMLP
jgi:uncharacterized repeat protein (TIGR03803 family)